EHRFEPNTPLYMQVSRGACVLHLSEHHGDGTPGTAIRIRVDELDQEWGAREMAVQDGSGNKLIFYRDLPAK
ncbi:MAG TPA: glyoxalase superfamily protein, partial [Kofleriaceae bacterium]|nr:glyoxalase superfamily protein [Kofleriaceae bacterium]